MKKRYNIGELRVLFLLLFTIVATPLLADSLPLGGEGGGSSLADVLGRVSESNPTLARYRAQADAVRADLHSALTLPDPEVELGYLWGAPDGVGNRRDFSVSQRLDFATIFGLKRRVAQSREALAELEYRQGRALLLLRATQLAVQVSHANALQRDYADRIATATTLADYYERQLSLGEVDRLVVNDARLSLAEIQAEAASAEAERQQLITELALLSPSVEPEVNSALLDGLHVSEQDLREAAAQIGSLSEIAELTALRQTDAAQAELRQARAASLPEVTAGYMAELTRAEKFRGVTLGVSIPLWANRGNVASARARLAAAEAQNAEDKATMATQRRLLQLQYEAQTRLSAQIDESLQHTSSEALLRRALQLGQISMVDYLSHRQRYYTLRRQHLDAERDALLALAQLLLL